MKLQLIMLDNPVIVSDEEIKEGDLILPPSNTIVRYDGQKYKGDEPLRCWQKVIAQSHQINWNGLESKFGYVNVEKLAKEKYLEDYNEAGYGDHDEFPMFLEGFKKAQELNGKKFSLHQNFPYQLVSADAQIISFDDVKKGFDFEDLFSLPKYKSFNIEVEMEECVETSKSVTGAPFDFIRPKITDGKIKITKKL